jgi:hypothetical protein
VIHCPEIAENSGCTDAASKKKIRQVFPLEGKAALGARQQDGRQNGSDDISEKGFLHSRHIAGQPHEYGHQAEEKSRQENEQDSFAPACLPGGI